MMIIFGYVLLGVALKLLIEGRLFLIGVILMGVALNIIIGAGIDVEIEKAKDEMREMVEEMRR